MIPRIMGCSNDCNCFHESFHIIIPAFSNAITFFIVCLFKWFAAIFYESFTCIQVIHKVRKGTLSLVINRVRFKRNLQKSTLERKTMKPKNPWGADTSGVFWVSPCLSFLLSSSTATTYIFTAPTCAATIILLEPCALNVEFQYFILSF